MEGIEAVHHGHSVIDHEAIGLRSEFLEEKLADICERPHPRAGLPRRVR
jgi:hypothetical protein